MLKCPYCIEERPSRSRLQTHVNQIHYLADTLPDRMAAIDVVVARTEAASSPQQREELQTAWDRVGAGLDKAGQEMAELRASLDAVDERMRRMDTELIKPSVVRRATLNQVWDKLLDAGHLAAAREVMKMIERVVD